MTRDDIIKMAREAGFMDADKNGVWITDGYWDDELRRFAELLAAPIIEAAMKSAEKAVEVACKLEREACAKVCDDWPEGREDVYSIAQAIRARGKQ
jgi:hypothetical protein